MSLTLCNLSQLQVTFGRGFNFIEFQLITQRKLKSFDKRKFPQNYTAVLLSSDA